eukprot:5461078-Pyramimonas_sp.AAC.1
MVAMCPLNWKAGYIPVKWPELLKTHPDWTRAQTILYKNKETELITKHYGRQITEEIKAQGGQVRSLSREGCCESHANFLFHVSLERSFVLREIRNDSVPIRIHCAQKEDERRQPASVYWPKFLNPNETPPSWFKHEKDKSTLQSQVVKRTSEGVDNTAVQICRIEDR